MRRHKKNKLKLVQYKDVPFFNLNGYNTWAKCVKVYDGDTCTLAMHHNKRIYKFSCRLAHIDTAELRSKDPQEVEIAKEARERLRELIGDDLIYVKCQKFDKYGRLLCSLYRSKRHAVSFNDALLMEGFAYKYEGGTKKSYQNWYKRNIQL